MNESIEIIRISEDTFRIVCRENADVTEILEFTKDQGRKVMRAFFRKKGAAILDFDIL